MRRAKLTAAAALSVVLLATCTRDTIVGSNNCEGSIDCSPPATVCGADGRCVDGCGANPASCVAGSICNTATGECGGGVIIGATCTDDHSCDPPDIVCRLSTHTCVAGCTLGAPCPSDLACNPSDGHCCDPGESGCPLVDDPMGCHTDSQCPGTPAEICIDTKCVPGCANGGACLPPLTCDTATGHCSTRLCARDSDCDSGSFCTQAGACRVLSAGGAIPCAGGKVVPYSCAIEATPAEFNTCVGAPALSSCPYCIDRSCFHPGLCASVNDCHRGDDCVMGLCRVQPAECPTMVSLAAVAAGMFAAGKEICVRARVSSIRNGYDGMIEIKLGTSPFLFVDVAPMYKNAGVKIPTVGEMVIVHGTVRWDAGHSDWELLPVDFIGP